ncbi:unnamed protein product [Lymnaea stagnalis]|uniref:Hexosyltransferase n=1 Tax=Lymnaea stagnalis TaxID=6523 RepID=A0AAV2HPR7_LYMST
MVMLHKKSSYLSQKLSRHAFVICLGGLFFTLVILVFMTVCNGPCDDKTCAWKRSESKMFWKENFLPASKNLKAKLVVLIISNPDNIHERDAIRETWLKDTDTNSVLPKFVVSTASLDTDHRDKINREELVHKDLIILTNIMESYQDLTNKVLQAFIWIDRHVDFQYVLKVDDDSYVRVSNILAELQHKSKDRLYWGFFDGRANVKTSGKWREGNWNLCDRYLPYARGGGYVLSSDLVQFIAINHELFQHYLSEDVSVGTWLAPLKINRHHDQNFDTEYISRGCLNTYLITHKQSVLKLRELNNNLLTLGRLCKDEVVLRASYEYDWNYPPSKCCIRPEKVPVPNLGKKANNMLFSKSHLK